MPTVTVACKLPHGLHLDLKGRERVTVRGTAVPFGTAAHDIGGFALTPNVDADFFAAWLEAYKNLEVVKRRLIFAYPKTQDATAQALELRDERSGLEPLDPDKPGAGIERVSA